MEKNRGVLICCIILSIILLTISISGNIFYTRLNSIGSAVAEIQKDIIPNRKIQADIEAVQETLKKEHEYSNEYFYDYGQRFLRQANETVKLWKALRKLQADFEAFKMLYDVEITDNQKGETKQEWPEAQPLPERSE